MKKIFNLIIYIFAAIGFSLTAVYFAVKFGITNEKGLVDTQRNTFVTTEIKKEVSRTNTTPAAPGSWQTSEEWSPLRAAIVKDKLVIDRVAKETGTNSRVITSIIVVEQLRLFSDSREMFKKVFAPLKILGVQSQFSWGVVGIKRETAIEIENNLIDTTSPFYLGKEYEHLLDFKTTNIEQERFDRLTDQHNRYYSYLYEALLIKQLEMQWLRAGYPINNNPAIIATLFNIGFKRSNPNVDPKSGGAPITINGTTYSFGSLAENFYNSEELITEFPR